MIGDILTGEEVCRGVGSSLLSFFPSLEIDDDVEKTKQMLLEYLNIELQWGTDEDEESELLYAQLDDMPFDEMIIYAKDRVIDGNNFTTFISSAMSYHITIMGMRNSCYIT